AVCAGDADVARADAAGAIRRLPAAHAVRAARAARAGATAVDAGLGAVQLVVVAGKVDADAAAAVAALAIAIERAGLIVPAAAAAEVRATAIHGRLGAVARGVLTGDADALCEISSRAVVVTPTRAAIRAALATLIAAT